MEPEIECGSPALTESAHLLLVGPFDRERAGQIGYGQVSADRALVDRCNDPRRQEGERHQETDVPLGEAFGRGDLVERCDSAREDGVHPGARSGDRLQQGVPRFRIDRPALRRRVDNAFLGRTVGSIRDRQMNRKVRLGFSLRLVWFTFRTAQSDNDLTSVDRDALDISQNQITIRAPIFGRSRFLIDAHRLLNRPVRFRLRLVCFSFGRPAAETAKSRRMASWESVAQPRPSSCSCAAQAWGRTSVRCETVRPAGAAQSAIA